MNQDDRIIRLEEYFSVLQKHVTEQDKVILELSETLDRLKREMTKLRDEAASGSDQSEVSHDERPPHY